MIANKLASFLPTLVNKQTFFTSLTLKMRTFVILCLVAVASAAIPNGVYCGSEPGTYPQ